MFGQSEWDAEKHGRMPRQWLKLHLAIDAQTGEIVAHVLTDKDTGDITAVPGLFVMAEGPIGSVIADGKQGEAAIAVQVLNRMIRIAKPISVRPS